MRTRTPGPGDSTAVGRGWKPVLDVNVSRIFQCAQQKKIQCVDLSILSGVLTG